ncbi:MAG TPA: hypothetical protein VHM90_13275 [Phycisphaerae bacterium]|nr:hypothetical protein [Phycisphaerae bacterium]
MQLGDSGEGEIAGDGDGEDAEDDLEEGMAGEEAMGEPDAPNPWRLMRITDLLS